MIKMNKRGQELSTTAIILIVLGVIVLVVLVLGFTIGWGKLAPWLIQSDNLDMLNTQCTVACTSQNQAGFCVLQRDVKWGNYKDTLPDTLKGSDGNPLAKVTCNQLAEKDLIDKCPAITCATA